VKTFKLLRRVHSNRNELSWTEICISCSSINFGCVFSTTRTWSSAVARI